jgi:hypothetical protein
MFLDISTTTMANFVYTVLTSGAVTAAAIYIAKITVGEKIKKSIGKVYDDELEAHKAQLKQASDTAIAKLNFQQGQMTIEHQIRCSGLYTKRADVISEAYRLLVRAHRDAHQYTSPVQYGNGPTEADMYTSAINSIVEFHDYVDRNQLWLPMSVCEKINPLVDEMRSKIAMFGAFRHIPQDAMVDHIRSQKQQAWDAAWQYFKDEMPAARSALELELRTLLAGSQ